MPTPYVQTDTDIGGPGAGCSGVAAGANAGRGAYVGGTPGSSEVQLAGPANESTQVIFGFGLGPGEQPGLEVWDPGPWVVPINHTTMDDGSRLVGVYVCDFTGSLWTAVASNESPGHGFGETGIITVPVIQPAAHVVQSQAASFPAILLAYQNTDASGVRNVGITPDQTILAPFPAVAVRGRAASVRVGVGF